MLFLTILNSLIVIKFLSLIGYNKTIIIEIPQKLKIVPGPTQIGSRRIYDI